jgi:hypothetical protein
VLENYEVKQHIENELSRGHRRLRTPLAVLSNKLPLYTVNRLLVPEERVREGQQLVDLELKNANSELCRSSMMNYLMEAHNVHESCRQWDLNLFATQDNYKITWTEFYRPTMSDLIARLEQLPMYIKWVAVRLHRQLKRVGKTGKTDTTMSGHGNLIVIDVARRKWYRYEPRGVSDEGTAADYATDDYFTSQCEELGYEYVSPATIFADHGPQHENYGIGGTSKPRGWCSMWTTWFFHVIATKQRANDLLSAETEAIDTSVQLGLDDFIPVLADDFKGLYKKMLEGYRPHRQLPWICRGNCDYIDAEYKLELARSAFIHSFAAIFLRIVFPDWDGTSDPCVVPG